MSKQVRKSSKFENAPMNAFFPYSYIILLSIIYYDILTLEVIRGQYRLKTVKWENSARDIIICIHADMIATRIIKYISF